MDSICHNVACHAGLDGVRVVHEYVDTMEAGVQLICSGDYGKFSSITRSATLRTFNCACRVTAAGAQSFEAYSARVQAKEAKKAISSTYFQSSAACKNERVEAGGKGLGTAPSLQVQVDCQTGAFVRLVKEDNEHQGKFQVMLFVCHGECMHDAVQWPELAAATSLALLENHAITGAELHTRLCTQPGLSNVTKDACYGSLRRARLKATPGHKAPPSVPSGATPGQKAPPSVPSGATPGLKGPPSVPSGATNVRVGAACLINAFALCSPLSPYFFHLLYRSPSPFRWSKRYFICLPLASTPTATLLLRCLARQ